MNFADIFAAGGFWAVVIALYNNGGAAAAGLIGNINGVLALLRIWVQRNMARWFRSFIAVGIVEIVLVVAFSLIMSYGWIAPKMEGHQLEHLGVSDVTWMKVLYLVPLANLVWLVVRIVRLSVKEIFIEDMIASVEWEMANPQPPNPPPNYISPKERNEGVGRLGVFTLLAPFVAPLFSIAALAISFMWLGDLYVIGYAPYFVATLIFAVAFFIHEALWLKVLGDVLSSAAAKLGEFIAKLGQELVRSGIAAAVPGITREDLDARLGPIMADIQKVVKFITEKWIAISIGIMLFFATAMASYQHAPLLIATIVATVGFFGAVAFDPSYTRAGLSFLGHRQNGVKILVGLIGLGWAFQWAVELTHSRGPRPGAMTYGGSAMSFIDAAFTNPFTWVLIIGGLALSAWKFWGDLPKWGKWLHFAGFALGALVLIGAIIDRPVHISNASADNIGRDAGPAAPTAAPTTAPAATSPRSPAPSQPVAQPRRPRTPRPAVERPAPSPLPLCDHLEGDPEFIRMAREGGHCRAN